MADTAASQKVTEIDPMFAIPQGAVQLTHNAGLKEGAADKDETTAIEPYNFPLEENANYGEFPLPTPDIIGIFEQRIRITADGNQVIDVILNVEDIAGASEYEYRITKI